MASPLTVILEFDRFRLDRRNQRLTKDGLMVVTPGKTLPLLLDLIEHRDQVVSAAKLVDWHFPKSPFGEEELSGEILKLKRLLDDTSQQSPLIRFVLGQGYQFDGEVTEYLSDSSSDHKFGSKSRDEYSYAPGRTPAKSKSPILGIVLAAVAVVAVGIGIWRFMPASSASSAGSSASSSDYSGGYSVSENGIPQVAILPFQSLTGQASDEGFNRNLTQGIFNALGKQSKVQVVPAAAIQKYLESGPADPVTAGQQLGAQLIVRGMAQRLAGHIVVKVQLVSTQDGSQIWSTSLEGESNDVAGIANQIAQKIVNGQ